MPDQKAMKTRCLGGFVGIKTFKIRIFGPKTAKFCPKYAFLGFVGSFGALLFGWLVLVARGLYLARHLFSLLIQVVKGVFRSSPPLCHLLSSNVIISQPPNPFWWMRWYVKLTACYSAVVETQSDVIEWVCRTYTVGEWMAERVIIWVSQWCSCG